MDLLSSMLRLGTPLIFAAMGGALAERSGIATICLEGVMLASAFAAAAVDYYTQNPWLALMAGCLVGALAMSLHALLSITAKADQIISGIAVNLFAAGLTPFFCKSLFGSATNSPSLDISARLPQAPLIVAALCLPFGIHYLFYRTGFGLRIQACGDAPEALLTSGISPKKVRYVALLLAGIVTSLGGTYLSIAHASQFTRDMTAGRGFIALAALIFGKWRPLPALFACLFFGFADALQIQLQSTVIFGREIPVQFIQALPYVVTLVVLVGFIGRARPPLAIAKASEI